MDSIRMVVAVISAIVAVPESVRINLSRVPKLLRVCFLRGLYEEKCL